MPEAGSYEMLWDCTSCSAKGLLAKSQRHCPECGAEQDPDKRYFPKEGEEKRIDGHVYEGADRRCSHCDSPMGARAKNCTNCGAPMDGSAREVKEVPAGAPPPAVKKRGHGRTIFIVLAVVLLLGILIWYRCIRKIEAELPVTAHTWTTSIAIESWGDVSHTAWRNEMPSSEAASAHCVRKERTTKQVPDGETCHDVKTDKKDGTFSIRKDCTPKTKSEPVYDDSCTWMQREWHKTDEAKQIGSGLTLAWATKDLPPLYASNEQPPVGTRRAGPKTQHLTLVFGDKACDDLSEATWRKYKDGQKVKLEVRASSGDIVCGDL